MVQQNRFGFIRLFQEKGNVVYACRAAKQRAIWTAESHQLVDLAAKIPGLIVA